MCTDMNLQSIVSMILTQCCQAVRIDIGNQVAETINRYDLSDKFSAFQSATIQVLQMDGVGDLYFCSQFPESGAIDDMGADRGKNIPAVECSANAFEKKICVMYTNNRIRFFLIHQKG